MREAIVLDVDQVLLDHLTRLREWVNENYDKQIVGLPDKWDASDWLQVDSYDEMKDLFREFSQDFEFGTLEAMPGAKLMLDEFLREGYSLICLTACGCSEITEALRKANRMHCFGNIFDEIHFVDIDDSKVEKMLDIQDQYDVVAFIDDKPENIEDVLFGTDVQNCILMDALHNREWQKNTTLDIKCAPDWYACKHLID